MKIVDRFSVYVSGLHPRIASIVTLSSEQWFGAFGAISQIRIIQGKAPHEAHIRFKLESAASNAINWVNSRLAHQGLFAKNGYQKYCTKFLQRKMCTRLSCSLLHAWKPFSEVLNPEKVRQLNPLKRAQIPLEANTNTPPVVVNKEKIKNPQTKAVENVPPQIHNIQTQISALQHSFDEARLVVDQLIWEVNDLELENNLLRQQNSELERRRVTKFSHSTSPAMSFDDEFLASPECTPSMYGVDEIVDALCGIHHMNLSPSSDSLTPVTPPTMLPSDLSSPDSTTLSPPTLNYPINRDFE